MGQIVGRRLPAFAHRYNVMNIERLDGVFDRRQTVFAAALGASSRMSRRSVLETYVLGMDGTTDAKLIHEHI